MRKIKRLHVAATITLFVHLVFARAALAEDWPKWRGSRGDGISRETGLAEKWPADGPNRLWSAEAGLGHSSPVGYEGKIYLFTLTGENAEALTAFDAAGGKELWSQSYERTRVRGGGGLMKYKGARATPTIDAGRVYTYGGTGDLYCRELDGGAEVWHTNILIETGASNLEWGVAGSPLVTEDRIYLQGGIGKGVAVAVAVDKGTGKIVWQSEARGVAGGGKAGYDAGGSYAHPILIDVQGTRQLVVFGGRAAYGIDPATGKTTWQEPWETAYDVHAATPVYHDGHLLISSEYGHGSMMLKLSPGGAKRLWENDALQSKFQPPILDAGFLYGNAGNRGAVKCLSWPDGKVQWETGGKLQLGAGGSLVRVGDKLITLSERGELSLALATPTQFKLISQTQLFDGRDIWATPLIYNGKLYAKGVDELVCLDLSAAK